LASSLEHLEKAVELNPLHLRTMNDLTTLYARSGRFEEQTELLKRALKQSPDSDDLAEGLVAAYVVTGRFPEAEEMVASHRFQPQHRTYGLRDKYRFLRYGQGARAFNSGDFQEALGRFQAALDPPVSLGVDDFQFESTPRVHYYIGRTLERLGRETDAQAAYQKSVSGLETLSSDWDSLNLETFYMALALERLGRQSDSQQLLDRLEEFALGQYHSTRIDRQAASRYLVALISKRNGDFAESRHQMEEALQIQPDLIPLRLELRGEVLDPLPGR
jgi:tetratricopeptide (TPR) repeat protein